MQSVVIQVTVMLMHVTTGQVSDRLNYHARIQAEGGGGGADHTLKMKKIGFLSNTGPESLDITKPSRYHNTTKISQSYQDITQLPINHKATKISHSYQKITKQPRYHIATKKSQSYQEITKQPRYHIATKKLQSNQDIT